MPKRLEILPNAMFGDATYLRDVEESGQRRCVFRCKCGVEFQALLGNVKRGYQQGCGCRRGAAWAAASKARSIASGGCHKPERGVWWGMLARCNNPKEKTFKYYGGRGITVCERWLKFENFLTDMGTRPSETHSIDRRDNNGSYTPENCYWATRDEQYGNRSDNLLITFEGITRPAFIWAKELGLRPRTFRNRLLKGWSVERAITTPLR